MSPPRSKPPKKSADATPVGDTASTPDASGSPRKRAPAKTPRRRTPKPVYRAGFVAVVGQPNVGKSTLVNALVGEKIAIVTPKPQTTRNRVRGVLTRPNMQIVLVDTPGIHAARSALNRAMVGTAYASLADVEAVLFVVDSPDVLKYLDARDRRAAAAKTRDASTADAQHTPDLTETTRESDPMARYMVGDRPIVSAIAKRGAPVVLALNKIDRIRKDDLLRVIDAYAGVSGVVAVVPISALQRDGIERIEAELAPHMPEGPALFPDDQPTDHPVRFLCAELLREQLFMQLHEEVPYGTYVDVDLYEEKDDLDHIVLSVVVSKDSHRGIVIGKGGAKMKSMASAARKEMELLLDKKVFLEVHVRVLEGWTEREGLVRRFGYMD